MFRQCGLYYLLVLTYLHPDPYPSPTPTPGPECLPRIVQRVHSRVRAAARRVLFEGGGGGERERLVEERTRDRRAEGESK